MANLERGVNMGNPIEGVGFPKSIGELNLAKISIETEKGSLEVLRKGGKVTSWKVKNSRGKFQEIFYQGSEKRTGMPELFPWYRKNGESMQQHGFGRDVEWSTIDAGRNHVIMKLSSNDLTADLKVMYPYSFEVEIKVEIDQNGDLIRTLSVKNTGDSILPLSPGLHPNLALAHGDKKGLKFKKGIEGFDFAAEDKGFDWDNDPPDIPLGASESGEPGKPPFPYKGEVIVVMPWGEISVDDVSPQGPQMKYWNVWADNNPADKNFITAAEPICGLDDAITKDPIRVAPGETWIWTVKFSVSFT